MTEPATPESPNSLKNIVIRVFLVCMVLFFSYALPPVRAKIDKFLMNFGVDMEERRQNVKQEAVAKVMTATEPDLVTLDLLKQSRHWLDYTSAKKKALREKMEGKVIDATGLSIYDVRQTAEIADQGYGEFKVKMLTTDFMLETGMPAECNFIALTEAEEQRIADLSSGTPVRLRGIVKSIGSLTIELKDCVLIDTKHRGIVWGE